MKTIDLICSVCQIIFVRPLKQYTRQLKESGPNYRPLCNSVECRRKFRFTKLLLTCDNCSISFKKSKGQFKRSEKHFCSRRCAALFNNQQRKTTPSLIKEIICRYCPLTFIVKQSSPKKVCDPCLKLRKNLDRNSRSGKKRLGGILRKTPSYFQCITCGTDIQSKDNRKKYCDTCRRHANIAHCKVIGKLAAAQQIRRSKNEILFATLCANEFSNTSTNEPFFVSKYGNWDADVILHDHKIAVSWNGIWHYKQVRKGHSVAQVQARDKIKMDVIRDNGYIPYVIVDMGKHNSKFVEVEFQKLKVLISKGFGV